MTRTRPNTFSITRYRNTLMDMVGVAMHKAREEGNEALYDALNRWRTSKEFHGDAKAVSMQMFTRGLDELSRRKFGDAVAHARAVAEAAARNPAV